MTEDFIQENEDRELFRRIKQGSEEAFRVVYGKYHRILYAVALKMLKDRSAAENAVQHSLFHTPGAAVTVKRFLSAARAVFSL